jgi:hypothetical protein
LAGASIDRDAADYSSTSANYPAGNPSNLPLTSTKFALPIPQVECKPRNSTKSRILIKLLKKNRLHAGFLDHGEL